MSLFRKSKFRGIASTLARLRDGWLRPETDSVHRKRRLVVDPLERREMLTVTVGDVNDSLVNQTTSGTTTTIAAQSIAVDNDGDFVVVWQRNDGTTESDLNIYARYFTNEVQRISLPQGVLTNNDTSAYASFTLTYGGNEVQKLAISGGTPPYSSSTPTVSGQIVMGFDLNGDSTIGSDEDFTFVYNGSQSQQAIAQTLQTAIQGLGAAPLNDVTVEALNSGEFLIQFGDSSGGQNVPQIRVLSSTWSSGFLPAALTSTVSEPIDITIAGIDPNNPNATARAIEQAFLATAETAYIAPVEFPWPDRISNDTALGPQVVPDAVAAALPEVRVTPVYGTGVTGRVFDITFGESLQDTDGSVVDSSSMKDHPELVIKAVSDELGNSLLASPQLSVVTVKQTSDEFRVNAPEPNNPLTGLPEKYDQYDPMVAMDADGDFVITWTSEVSALENPGSVTDIFARRFSPMGWLDGSTPLPSDVATPGVRALGSQFRVNSFTTNAQGEAVVSMDDDGNFVVAWSGEGQTVSHFNTIYAQRFNRDGERVGNWWVVNTPNTNWQMDPYVSSSADGHFAITWLVTDDPGPPYSGIVSSIQAVIYNPDGTISANQFGAGGGGPATSAWDDANRVIIGRGAAGIDADNLGINSSGIRAQIFSSTGALVQEEFQVNSATLTPGSAYWPLYQGNHQVGIDADGDVVISYDGYGPEVSDDVFIPSSYWLDLMTKYPDVPDDVWEAIFNPAGGLTTYFYDEDFNFYANNGDIDGAIETILYGSFGDATITITETVAGGFGVDEVQTIVIENAEGGFFTLSYFGQTTANIPYGASEAEVQAALEALGFIGAGNVAVNDTSDGYVVAFQGALAGTNVPLLVGDATQLTDTGLDAVKLGQLRVLLEEIGGLLRGEANGVMFTRMDANNPTDDSSVSDSIANAQRDGRNQRNLIMLDNREWTRLDFRLSGPVHTTGLGGVSGYTDFSVQVALNNHVIDVEQTRQNIENALQALARTGQNWSPSNTPFEGTIEVRTIPYSEAVGRAGTPWKLPQITYGTARDVQPGDIIYEVVFQGEVHDLSLTLTGRDSTVAAYEIQEFTITAADANPVVGQLRITQGANSNDIDFNQGNIPQFVAALEAQISNWNNNAPVNVTWTTTGTTWTFRIAFGNNTDYAPVGAQRFQLQGDPPTWSINATGGITRTLNNGGNADGPAPQVRVHTYGNSGTVQTDASLGVEPDGDYVMAWTQYTQSGDYEIYFRRFNETTDTAGPKVTDFLLADGMRLTDGGQVNDTVQTITVTFDEEMKLDSSVNSITNVNNWALLRDGQIVNGGIASVVFGMNVASGVQGGSNKWEALITLDGNGASPGVTPLLDGNYTIVAKNSLQDVPGNALNRSGYNESGFSVLRSFNVVNPSNGDAAVNIIASGNQNTYNPADNGAAPAHTFPEAAQATASDADGDYVVVWTSDTPGQEGVWARLYDAAWSESTIGRASTIAAATTTIRVSSDPTATFASVAMDDDGDFIVTWSAYDAATGWDIYARRFNAAGNDLHAGEIGSEYIPTTRALDPTGTTFRVNSETEDNQKFSTVAMDADGDFVITWQSNGQDGGGYGVYAKHYSQSGEETSGASELQRISFVNNVRGTFRLVWSGDASMPDISPDITYNGDAFSILDAVRDALAQVGAETEVFAVGVNDIYIQFTGDDAATDVPQILVSPVSITGDVGARIEVTTVNDGTTAEFLVNGTTANDQLFPAVAMDRAGNFIVSWTSYGQGGDAAYESNVYAQRYIDGVGQGEFLVNQNTAGDEMWSSVAMDADGDFVVTWTAYNQDGVGSGYGAGVNGEEGVFARRYNSSGAGVGNEFQVNTFAAGSQQVSRVAMDSDGDFVITWESFQDRPAPGSGLPDSPNSFGIYAQRYVRNALVGQAGGFYGANGENGGEFVVNRSADGDQRSPGIGMDDTGDFVIVWTGPSLSSGTGNANDIFYSHFDKRIDDAGPTVTDIVTGNPVSASDVRPTDVQVTEGAILTEAPTHLVVYFNEELSTLGGVTGATSVTNPTNWTLTLDGQVIYRGVSEIAFAPAEGTDRKWQAVLTLDGDSLTSGNQALVSGNYTLTLSANVEDVFENAFDGDGDGTPGGAFVRNFEVLIADSSNAERPVHNNLGGDQHTYNPADNANQPAHTFPHAAQATASDADGDYVAVWTDDASGREGIWATLFNVAWDEDTLGRFSQPPQTTEIQITSDSSATFASVAMDDDGDFVVTWSQYNAGTAGWDVYYRRFNAAGQALRTGEIGSQELLDPATNPADTTYRVNVFTDGAQKFSNVAMDADGDFVITWQSDGQDGNGYGVYAKRYDLAGEELGGTNETQVINFVNNVRGTFRLVWTGDDSMPDNSTIINYSGDAFAIAQAVQNALAGLGAAVKVQAASATSLYVQFINEDGNRDVPQIIIQPVSLTGDAEARIDVQTIAEGAMAETLVNTTVQSDQMFASVAMDRAGAFVVTWTSYGQGGDAATEANVYARRFDGTAFGAEFLVNQTVAGDQMWSSVDLDADGDFVIAWTAVGQEATGSGGGVFARRYDNTAAATSGQFQVNTFTDGAQQVPRVAMDADGDFVIAWESFQDLPPTGSGALNIPNSYGIYAQRYARTALVGQPAYGANGEIDAEFAVNRFTKGNQRSPAVSMDDTGDYVIVWTGPSLSGDAADGRDVFYRHFDMIADDAGPTVTDIVTGVGGRPTDVQVYEGAVLDVAPTQLVVYFSEEMSTVGGATGAESILNPNNWNLTLDGVAIYRGVSSVTFAPAEGTDRKWQAVLTLDSDASTIGVQPLESGVYVLTLNPIVEDVFENKLDGDSDGTAGGAFVRTFSILTPGDITEGEVPVPTDATGDNFTYNPGDNAGQPSHTFPHASQATASDADGDYVVVWTSDIPGKQGVWAKLYDVVYVVDSLGRSSQSISEVSVINPATGAAWLNNEIQITADPSATFASVAMDDDGDFVVTWSAYSGATGWDVFARRFNAAGTALRQGESGSQAITSPATSAAATTFRVNSETAGTQKFSTVAMDADGDFVITWQSDEQDGSGYGVYAKRFGQAGEEVGGTNEVQILSFVNNVRGTFRLVWNGDPARPDTSSILTFNGNAFDILQDVQDALFEIGITAEVQALGMSDIAIHFVGNDAAQDVPQIGILPVSLTGDTGARIATATRNDGATAEFRVNNTTDNDQMFPAIDMTRDGSFTITWTSYGQDGDAANEANVYARQYGSNDPYRRAAVRAAASTGGTAAFDSQLVTKPLIVSADDPANHVTQPGTGYDGVGLINVDWSQVGGIFVQPTPWSGSGTLLSSGKHVLTAAHVVTDDIFNNAVDADYVTVTFTLPNGSTVAMEAANVYVNPGWIGSVAFGNDIAIIELKEVAPLSIERHDIMREEVAMGSVFRRVGYGLYGQGNEGWDDTLGIPLYLSGTKRDGENTYEAHGDILGYDRDSILMYDFDNGLAANDAFGVYFGMNHLGLGSAREVTAAPGDSGGPNFINGLIAGVTSFGTTRINFGGTNVDVTQGVVDSSFGEFGGDVNVPFFADWIDSIVGDGNGAQGTEYLVNQTTAGSQMWSSVAVDADGDSVITWTGEGQETGTGANTGTGIFARRYDNTGAGVGNEFQVNTFTDGAQQLSRVAMDADGDFVIAWESFQDMPAAGTPLFNIPESYGIYAQRYVRTALLGQPAYGVNGEIDAEFEVNVHTERNQRSPALAMDDAGDYVVVWTGANLTPGLEHLRNVFQRHFDQTVADTAGPTVTDIVTAVGGQATGVQIEEGVTLDAAPTQLVVYFSEDMFRTGGASGVDSILNPNNWLLSRDGVQLYRGVSSVSYSAVEGSDRKWQAVLTLDDDSTVAGEQALSGGDYTLTLRQNVKDVYQNRLDGDNDGAAGGAYSVSFSVFADETEVPGEAGSPDFGETDEILPVDTFYTQDSVAIASNKNGDYVAVWVTYAAPNDEYSLSYGNIMARLYDRYGNAKGPEFIVNSRTDTSTQVLPDVAMDEYGNFVVVWSGQGGATTNRDEAGVFMRRFSAFGQAVDAAEVRVNTITNDSQADPAVSMNDAGQFVVTWSSYQQDGDRHGVYAKYFSSFSAAGSAEIPVNTSTGARQWHSDVAIDAAGRWVAVWEADGQDASGTSIQARRFNGTAAATGEISVNVGGNSDQTDPKVAMAPTGEFVVTWTSMTASAATSTDVYARRFTAAGAARDSGDILVSQTTANAQATSDVSMDNSGNFVVTWSSRNQESYGSAAPLFDDYGIFARRFSAGGAAIGGEYRVNAIIKGNQTNPVVAVDDDGDYVVAWVGPEWLQTGTDGFPTYMDGNTVYHRVVRVNSPEVFAQNDGSILAAPVDSASPQSVLNLTGTAGDDYFEFLGGTDPSTWTVRINGVVQTIPAGTFTVNFNGMGGNDAFYFRGTGLADVAELRSGTASVQSASYAVTATNVETVRVDGGGGNDEARFFDTAGDDSLIAKAGETKMAGNGYLLRALGFANVTAVSSLGGADVANISDTAGNETLEASKAETKLSGEGYSIAARGFAEAHVFGGSGGVNTALFSDSTGDDVFESWPDQAKLSGDGYFIRALDFNTVQATSTNGGQDTALFFGNRGVDTFVARTTDATLSGTTTDDAAYSNSAYGFFSYMAAGKGNHGDTATLYDSAGDDSFKRTDLYAVMTDGENGSESYFLRAFLFHYTYGIASTGTDTARLYDSAGNDLFEATPTVSTLTTDRFLGQATGFDFVHGYASTGTDVAMMYDSSGDDSFVAAPTQSKMWGSNYYTRALQFDEVHGMATGGGNDTAILNDTALDDYLEAVDDWAMLENSSQGLAYWASGFDSVTAKSSNPGGDKRSVSATVDFLLASDGWTDI